MEETSNSPIIKAKNDSLEPDSNETVEDDFSAFATSGNNVEDDGDDFGEFDEFTDFNNGLTAESNSELVESEFGNNNQQQQINSNDNFNQFAGRDNDDNSGGKAHLRPSSSDRQELSLQPIIDYSNATSETIITQFTDILDTLFPLTCSPSLSHVHTANEGQLLDKQNSDIFSSQDKKSHESKEKNSSPNNYNKDRNLESILNSVPESMEIWERLAPDPEMIPFSWKQSSIRKQFYDSLGVSSDTFEEQALRNSVNILPRNSVTHSTPSSKKSSASTPTSRAASPQSLNLQSHTRVQSVSTTSLPASNRKNLGTSADSRAKNIALASQLDLEKIKVMSSIPQAEKLYDYSISELQSLFNQLDSLYRQTSETLTFWLDQREQTIMDAETYNQMIECLVGHAQKIRNGNGNGKETSNLDNKGGKQSPSKKNSKMASGFASLSLSFKKQKFQVNSSRRPTSVASDPSSAHPGKNIGNSTLNIHERNLSL
ncbi:13525_t:CDS:2 [Ambispora gerdemannii]|uniref:13525_t:CDS:1 n=1 Tax=Ambispora gerdemannii TaxID=144530 RepID=A0A9N8V4A3_9GLOM|nr:13525_t:CDS:2 [Ambispora gerdemannii]